MTVLIADDHQMFREGLCLLLQQVRAVTKIIAVSNGLEALETVTQQVVDIVLMDIEMPVMDGIAATKAIRELDGNTTAIIALTMFNRRQDIMRLYDVGVAGYLLKDSSITEVRKAIALVSEGKEYYCDAVKEVLFQILRTRARGNSEKMQRETLTQREKDVLIMICEQYSTEEIAARLFVSTLTIGNHRKSILQKTKAKNVAGMVMYALKNGIYHFG